MKRMLIAASLGFLPQCATTALGQGADFYKGKQVDLYIGYSVGGGYDIYARILARHLGKHLPGKPVVVPKNMEGAGSRRLGTGLRAGRSGEASRSIRCSGDRARSSRPPSSAGSAARTTR